MSENQASETPAPSPIPEDPMAALVAPDIQRQAARTVEEAFARVFRLSVGDTGGDDLATVEAVLRAWVAVGGDAEARALRLALLLSGLDQWGLAYAQAFGLVGLPALSQLLGVLRTTLDAEGDARFQRCFAALEAEECAAMDFKVALRRQLHLALWHAMIAGDERADALRILTHLGSMMASQVKQQPMLGWRLVADALAHIQIQCLNEGLAQTGLAQETTQSLFAALEQALPREDFRRIMAAANQVLLGWQQSRRPH